MTSSQNQTTLREYKEFDNHEMIITLTDKAVGLNGYIAIHSTKRGPAQGGTRMLAYDSEESAIHDALNLSQAMSYKCALANLPYGGGKGVIIVDSTSDRQKILTAYAKMVNKLNGLFKTGTDVGLSDEDVIAMGQFTPHMMGVVKADRGELNTSKTAARGVFTAMKAALGQMYGNDDFKSRKIAIKGVGKLGAELTRLIHSAGGQVVIADTDEAKCRELLAELADIIIVPPDQIYKQVVDIYAPCALGNEFNDHVIGALQCKAVVGGANNQLPDEDAGDKLFQKRILYAPDYVANAGGLIFVVDELEVDGFNKERVLKRVAGIQSTLETIFRRSAKENTPTNRIANAIALERIKSHG